MTDLGTFGGLNSAATAINSRGTATGQSDMAETSSGVVYDHAFLYLAGRLIDLGVVAGDVGSNGWAISDSDEVVGISNTSGGSSVAMNTLKLSVHALQLQPRSI